MKSLRIYKDNEGAQFLSATTLISEMIPFDRHGFETWAWSQGHDPADIVEMSGVLGERYHAYFENEHHGISDWANVVETDQDKRFLEATEKFFDMGWEILESEVRVVNRDLLYAGRFDMIMRNKKLGIEKALGDVKTWGAWRGKPMNIRPDKLKKLVVQLNMYRRALGERLPMYGVLPDATGALQVREVELDESWLDAVAEARLRLLKAIENGQAEVSYEQLQAFRGDDDE